MPRVGGRPAQFGIYGELPSGEGSWFNTKKGALYRAVGDAVYDKLEGSKIHITNYARP